jgi:hypothetical protein
LQKSERRPEEFLGGDRRKGLYNEFVGQPFQADGASPDSLNLGCLGQAGKPDLQLRCKAVFVGTYLLQGGLRHPVRRLCGLVAALLAISFAAAELFFLPG